MTTTEPLRLTLDVACPPDHAFAVWTSGIDSWWPRDHTVTGGPGLRVVLEPRIGGRIFEHTADGAEHDWGEVTLWEPPRRLAYRWHLGQPPGDATVVDIQFVPDGAGGTRVEIEHRGWERLGQRAEQLRDRNSAGWAGLLPHFHEATDHPDTDSGSAAAGGT